MPITTQDARPSMIAAAVGVAGVALPFAVLWWQHHPVEVASAPESVVTRAEAAAPAPAAHPEARQVPQAFAAFAAFASGESPDPLPLDHGYTARGLRLLADALAALQPGLPAEAAARLRHAADDISANPRSSRHADIARDAFLAASESIGEMNGGARDGLEAAARRIDPARPLREQRDRVDRFFDLSASAMDAQHGS